MPPSTRPQRAAASPARRAAASPARVAASVKSPKAAPKPSDKVVPLSVTLKAAAKKALGGGIAGALAMVIQVFALMWMRTTINFQHAKGMSTLEAMSALYAEGGISRFYQGMAAALLQAPLSRFGDTASNAGALALLAGVTWMSPAVKTFFASSAAGVFRIAISPIDTLKTTLQVQGPKGLGERRTVIIYEPPHARHPRKLSDQQTVALPHCLINSLAFLDLARHHHHRLLRRDMPARGNRSSPARISLTGVLSERIATDGLLTLYSGSIATSVATFMGHYPWFMTYNYLQAVWPKPTGSAVKTNAVRERP